MNGTGRDPYKRDGRANGNGSHLKKLPSKADVESYRKLCKPSCAAWGITSSLSTDWVIKCKILVESHVVDLPTSPHVSFKSFLDLHLDRIIISSENSFKTVKFESCC